MVEEKDPKEVEQQQEGTKDKSLVPLIIMLIGTILYTLIIFLMRYKTEIMKFKLDKRNKEN